MTTLLQAIGVPAQSEVRKLYDAVKATHPNLEKLCHMRALADCSNETLFTIGASGTGKTMSQKWLIGNIKRQLIQFQAVGISSFKAYNERLQAEPTTIIVEDLSVAKTVDIMIKTAFFLTHMTYEGRLVRPVQPYPIEVYSFRGSTQIDFQPFILAHMTLETEFETDIKDKALRWYHLRMPLEAHLMPPSSPPKHPMEWKYIGDIQVDFPSGLKRLKVWQDLIFNFKHEFTEGRADEHAQKLIKANALLNGRKEVHSSDLSVIEHLSRNFRTELEIFVKQHLEGQRFINPDILPILSMMATYRSYEIEKVMLHFQVKRTQIYNILNGVSDYVLTTGKQATIVPTEATKQLLKTLGEWS